MLIRSDLTKVHYKDISKEMRLRGFLFQKLIHLDSKKRFNRAQKMLVKYFKNKKPENSNITVSEKYIKNRDGKEIRLCIYAPKNIARERLVTGLLWMHGGGYAIGLPEIEMSTIEKIILTSETVVISPDYRLSLDAPFPAAFNDCYDSLLWMKKHAKELGILENQIFIGGESAGGGLTCCLSAYARDKGEVGIAYQIPLYPMLDDRMKTQSMIDNNAPVWNEKNNKAAWKLYLGNKYQTSEISTYVSPSRLDDYSNLPPTFTFVGDIEPFFDETLAYINNLKAAGVHADIKIFNGAFHAFDMFAPNSDSAKRATKAMLENYKYAVHNFFKEQKNNR